MRALHDPQKFFDVEEHLQQALEKVGFMLTAKPSIPGEIHLSLKERDGNDWKETAAGEVAITADFVSLWKVFWTHQVNNLGETYGGAPLREVKIIIEALKNQLGG